MTKESDFSDTDLLSYMAKKHHSLRYGPPLGIRVLLG